MRFKTFILLICVMAIATSFESDKLPPLRTYHIFYIENSSSKNMEGLNAEMFSTITNKVDSLQNDRFSAIGFVLANGAQSEFAASYSGAKRLLEKLAAGSTALPNVYHDRPFVVERISETDISNVRAIQIHYFLTESGLLNAFAGGVNAGFMTDALPKELQSIIGCREDNIKVSIYYPADAKKINPATLEQQLNFPSIHPDFISKIKVNAYPL